jgi:hypothetical protein
MISTASVILLELGIFILNDEGGLIRSVKFKEPAETYHSLSKGDLSV